MLMFMNEPNTENPVRIITIQARIVTNELVDCVVTVG
jgi:hypothetical protein